MDTYRMYKLSVLVIGFLIFGFSEIVSGQSICNGNSCTSDGSQINLTDIQSQIATTAQFVNSGGFISQDNLRTNFPCAAGAMLGKYAKVMDVYQTVSSVAVCETDGTTYYWRPQRTDYATTVTQTTGTLTLVPFVTSPIVIMSTSPSGTLNVVPSTVNAWPGAQFRIYMPAAIPLLSTINLTGLVGGGTVTALQGRDYVLTYTSAGWKTN